jgi:hypothetical protein
MPALDELRASRTVMSSRSLWPAFAEVWPRRGRDAPIVRAVAAGGGPDPPSFCSRAAQLIDDRRMGRARHRRELRLPPHRAGRGRGARALAPDGLGDRCVVAAAAGARWVSDWRWSRGLARGVRSVRRGGGRNARAGRADRALGGRGRVSLRAQSDVPRRRRADRRTGAAARAADLVRVCGGIRHRGGGIRTWLRGAGARAALWCPVRGLSPCGSCLVAAIDALGPGSRNETTRVAARARGRDNRE